MRDDRLGLGIIGMGRGFMLTLPALRADRRLHLAAAFDPRVEAREAFTRDFGAPAYDDTAALLASRDVAAVYIASPHAFHTAQTIAALDAGKHVLVEKPMAISVEDGARMVMAARSARRVLLVGPSHGHDAQVLRARMMIASGRYGRVRHVTALNYTDFMYRPRRPEELADPTAGGVVFSQAAHQIEVVRRLVGDPIHSVRAVTGDWDTARRGVGAYSALLDFTGGATATLTYSGYAHYDSDELVGWISELGRSKNPAAYGEARQRLAGLDAADEAQAKLARTYGPGAPDGEAAHHEHFGFILVSCDHADLKLLPTGIMVYADDERRFEPIDPPAVPRAGIIDAFLAAIGGDPGDEDGRIGLEIVAACDALLTSGRIGADVTLGDALRGVARED
jgi:phthalate 4,5-cis-dihydrodiol dehydrogenase